MSTVVNNSTNAVNQNMVIPSVYSELVREKIAGHVIVSQATEIKGDLKGKPGETISFVKYAYIGDSKDIKPGEPMDVTKMKQTTTQATIKMVAAPAVSVNDFDSAVELGDALDEASKQQGISMSRKLDMDCIKVALTTPLKYKLADKGKITFEEMNGILGLYGDDANISDFHFIAVHSAFVPSFLAIDGFVDATKTFNREGNGIVLNNLLGYFRGIPVVVSDRLFDTSNQEAFILSIKKNSIGIIPKEAPFVEVSRDASTRTNTIYCSDYYAVALTDDTGVVLAKTVIPEEG